MKELKYVITDPLGIHARPAGKMVKLAGGYKCDIQIIFSGKTANAKRIMGVMALSVKQGNEITITFSGEDEEQAAQAINKFLAENF